MPVQEQYVQLQEGGFRCENLDAARRIYKTCAHGKDLCPDSLHSMIHHTRTLHRTLCSLVFLRRICLMHGPPNKLLLICLVLAGKKRQNAAFKTTCMQFYHHYIAFNFQKIKNKHATTVSVCSFFLRFQKMTQLMLIQNRSRRFCSLRFQAGNMYAQSAQRPRGHMTTIM